MTLLSSILTKGYHVIPGFLDSKEIDGLVSDLENDRLAYRYTIGLPHTAAMTSLGLRLQGLLDELAASGEFTPRHIGAYFATIKSLDLDWHQDHDSYFINQTHKHCVIIYIPIIKPDPRKSNLTIVPVDVLRSRAPEVWNSMEWKGASRVSYEDGTTTITDDQNGGTHGELDFPLDEIAVSPELSVGDALITRGDMIHRTQDTDTERVVLSIRAFDDSQTVTRDHFHQTTPVKERILQMNVVYEGVQRVFEGVQELPLAELLLRSKSSG